MVRPTPTTWKPVMSVGKRQDIYDICYTSCHFMIFMIFNTLGWIKMMSAPASGWKSAQKTTKVQASYKYSGSKVAAIISLPEAYLRVLCAPILACTAMTSQLNCEEYYSWGRLIDAGVQRVGCSHQMYFFFFLFTVTPDCAMRAIDIITFNKCHVINVISWVRVGCPLQHWTALELVTI